MVYSSLWTRRALKPACAGIRERESKLNSATSPSLVKPDGADAKTRDRREGCLDARPRAKQFRKQFRACGRLFLLSFSLSIGAVAGAAGQIRADSQARGGAGVKEPPWRRRDRRRRRLLGCGQP